MFKAYLNAFNGEWNPPLGKKRSVVIDTSHYDNKGLKGSKLAAMNRSREAANRYIDALGGEHLSCVQLAEKMNSPYNTVMSWMQAHKGVYVRIVRHDGKRSIWGVM